MNNLEFKDLDEWKRSCRNIGLRVKELGADIEDPATHWYAGDDFWYFDQTGGDLLPRNGYYYDTGDSADSCGQLVVRSDS